MNELRMYVEHLFEGKVLTSENIELKEEIYGNLMARYEDLLSEGLSEADALRRTKESITSVDDVLAGRDVDAAADGAGCGAEELEGDASGEGSLNASRDPDGPQGHASDGGFAYDPHSNACDHDHGASETVRPLDADERRAGDAPSGVNAGDEFDTHKIPGVPVSPYSNGGDDWGDDGASKKRKLWPWGCLGCVAFVIALGMIGALMFGVTSLADKWGVQDDSVEGVEVKPVPEDASTSADESQSANPEENRGHKNDAIRVDEQGEVWIDGELGDELANDVVKAGYGELAPYTNTDLSDAKVVEALIGMLPMGDYASGVDVTKGIDVLSLAYRELPESLDDDSIEAALAYDVTALLCTMPLVNEIQITVTESDDPLDESYYVFSRDAVQSCYGVRLDGELINETGWRQLKEDSLYRRKFIDHMLDAAEREWE